MVGIVKCGAFGCFDEFNRLEEKTLSLISLQIKEIQEALKTKLPQITLLNKQVLAGFSTADDNYFYFIFVGGWSSHIGYKYYYSRLMLTSTPVYL